MFIISNFICHGSVDIFLIFMLKIKIFPVCSTCEFMSLSSWLSSTEEGMHNLLPQ